MTRVTLAFTVVLLLACGGLDSATDALGERLGEQLTEELIEGVLEQGMEGADVEVNGDGLVVKTQDGDSIALTQTAALPENFPTHPKGFVVKQVNEVSGSKRIVNAIGTTADLPKLVEEVRNDLVGKGYEVKMEQTGSVGGVAGQSLLMGKDQDVVMLVAQERPKDSSVTLSWTRKP